MAAPRVFLAACVYMPLLLCAGLCTGFRIDLEVHSSPGLNVSAVTGEALARFPLLAAAASDAPSAPLYVRRVAPSLAGLAASSAAFWNQYLAVGGGPREIIVDVEAQSFADDKVGTASCWFDRANGNRECLLRVDASFAYAGFVMVHEMAHAILLWAHATPLCVYDAASTQRCIDGGGHWSPYEGNEVLSPYVGDTMFVSDYTILAASSAQSGGVGVTGLCDATCASGECVENRYFTAAPRVCASAYFFGDNEGPAPIDGGGGGGGGGGSSGDGCGAGCIAAIAGGGAAFLCIVIGVSVASARRDKHGYTRVA